MGSDETHACDCGATFDTLEKLKEHAKEHHPEEFDDE